MPEPESIRQICARKVRAYREKRDQESFGRLLAEVSDNGRLRIEEVPIGAPKLTLTCADMVMLRHMGIGL